MADINVERKKKNIWPWILAAIVVLLLIWGFAAMNDNEAGYAPATAPAVVDDPAAVDTDPDAAATTETTPPPTE